jgi:hypothetical protein
MEKSASIADVVLSLPVQRGGHAPASSVTPHQESGMRQSASVPVLTASAPTVLLAALMLASGCAPRVPPHGAVVPVQFQN